MESLATLNEEGVFEAQERADVIERLSTRYEASRRLFEGDVPEGEEMVLDPATLRALRELGYIDLEPDEPLE